MIYVLWSSLFLFTLLNRRTDQFAEMASLFPIVQTKLPLSFRISTLPLEILNNSPDLFTGLLGNYYHLNFTFVSGTPGN